MTFTHDGQTFEVIESFPCDYGTEKPNQEPLRFVVERVREVEDD